jgi:hypothetical protein
LLACFLRKKIMHSFFGLSMKGASLLNSWEWQPKFSGKFLLGLLQNEAKKSQVLGGVHEHLTIDIINFVFLLSPLFNTERIHH